MIDRSSDCRAAIEEEKHLSADCDRGATVVAGAFLPGMAILVIRAIEIECHTLYHRLPMMLNYGLESQMAGPGRHGLVNG